MATTRLAAVLLCAAAMSAGAQSLEPGVEASIHPGDDFYAFANGEWIKATQIPAGSVRWTARNDINVLTQQQVTQLIDGAANAAAGSDARKVADYRAAYLDQTAIDARGIALLPPLFERIDGVHDKTALVTLLGSTLRADVDPINWGVYDSAHLLGIAVQAGNHGEPTYVAYLLQGGLGLGDRELYLDAAAQAKRDEYQKHIAHVLELAGFKNGSQRAGGVIALETEIARTHATAEASGDDHSADNLWTRDDFAQRAPGIDWAAFFAAAGLAKQSAFVVWQPSAVEGAAKLIASQPLAAWQDYLRFHTIVLYTDVLPRAFTEGETAPRAQMALDATQRDLGGALGRLYAERYFPADRKARVEAIVRNVIISFGARVDAVSWLSPASKLTAQAKLKKIYFGVGYPESWPNYSHLRISVTDAFGNRQRVDAWNYQNALAKLGTPLDRKEWSVPVQVAGAALNFQQNSYNFAAALLQAPKFDANASDAYNYGAIGAVMGHEVTHYVDTLGADYDVEGSKTHWWTAEDLAQYTRVTDPLVRQFSQYRALPDFALDGKLSLVENLADLGGLNAAFDAYRKSLGARANDKEFVRQQDRQFFIGFARTWRAKYLDAGMRKQAGTDHAPETFRVSTVRNLDAWYDAFGIMPGDKLYLEPKERVRVW